MPGANACGVALVEAGRGQFPESTTGSKGASLGVGARVALEDSGQQPPHTSRAKVSRALKVAEIALFIGEISRQWCADGR